MTLDHVSTPDEKLLERVARAYPGIQRNEYQLELMRVELVAAMRAAHQAGHSYRAIAQAAGISHQRVAQLLQKGEGK